MQKNSLVMFRNRMQTSAAPMRVAAVRTVDGKRQLKVGDAWYSEGSLMPYREWQARAKKPEWVRFARYVEREVLPAAERLQRSRNNRT